LAGNFRERERGPIINLGEKKQQFGGEDEGYLRGMGLEGWGATFFSRGEKKGKMVPQSCPPKKSAQKICRGGRNFIRANSSGALFVKKPKGGDSMGDLVHGGRVLIKNGPALKERPKFQLQNASRRSPVLRAKKKDDD